MYQFITLVTLAILFPNSSSNAGTISDYQSARQSAYDANREIILIRKVIVGMEGGYKPDSKNIKAVALILKNRLKISDFKILMVHPKTIEDRRKIYLLFSKLFYQYVNIAKEYCLILAGLRGLSTITGLDSATLRYELRHWDSYSKSILDYAKILARKGKPPPKPR